MKFVKLFLTLTLLTIGIFAASASWASTISGTVTNNSGKSGWVNIVLTGQFGDTGLGTAVKVNSGSSTSYTVYGVNDGTYQVDAYVDVTDTGIRHANDPATSAAVIVVEDDMVQNLTIGAPTIIPMSQNLDVSIVPTDTGAFVNVQVEKDNNGRAIPDSINLSCNPGAIAVSVPSSDNSFALLSGLTNGSTLNCTATPVVNGSPDAAHQGSKSSTVGDCNFTASCAAGTAHLTGKVNFDISVNLTGKTLYVAAVPPSGGTPIVAVAKTLSNPATVDIYGVPAGTYKIYTILDDNSHTIGPGDLQTQDQNAPVVVLNGLDSLITLPNVTIKAVDSYVTFSITHNKNAFSGNTDSDYSFGLQVNSGLKRPVNVIIKDTDKVTINQSVGHNSNGSGLSAFSPNMTRPVIGNTYIYVDIQYSDNSTQNNIPMILKAIRDDFPSVSFPSGNVRLPNNTNPMASWRTPGPLPGYFYSYGARMDNQQNNGDDPNDFLMPTTLSTTFDMGGSPLNNDQQTNWNLNLKDQFGNSTNIFTQFTPKAIGPVISSFTPSSGPLSGSIAVTGSGFSGATAVSINGQAMPYTVVDNTHITINPSGTATSFNSGPILVTAGGVTGASSNSYTGLATVGGTISDTLGNLSGATIKLVGSNPVVSTTSISGGVYSLFGIPAGIPYLLQVTASGHLPLYSKFLNQTNTGSGFDWKLYTATQVAAWGVTPGKGVIRAKVSSQDPPSGATNSNIADATVTATSWLHPDVPYSVLYDDNTGNTPVSGSKTPANGVFYVMNIDEGDIVTVNAQATGYAFQPLAYQVHGDAVSQGRAVGAAVPTGLTATTAATPNGDGSYTGPITVGFTLTPSATYYGFIYYTTDGRDPQFYGTSLSIGSTFSLSTTATVRYIFRSSLNNEFGPSGSTTFTIPQQPTISNFFPNAGIPGTQVLIQGSNFDTTPVNNIVKFTGTSTAAQVLFASSNQLTVVVPADATPATGPISVTLFGLTANSGSNNFTVTTTTTLSGTVQEPGVGNVSGALVQQYNNSLAPTATSNGSGNFTLNGVPQNAFFIVKTSAATYADSYINFFSNSPITGQTLILVKSPLSSTLGNAPGTGIIRGRLTNPANGGTPIAGATIAITPSNAGTIVYGSTAPGSPPDTNLTATTSSGVFYIRNVPLFTYVNVTPTQSDFNFSPGGTSVIADALSQLELGGFLINAPSGVTINSNTGTAGATVTLAGNFLNTNSTNYQVLFDGATSATINGIGSNSFTFTIPFGSYSTFSASYYGQQFSTGNLLSVAIAGSGSVNDTGAQATGFSCASGNCKRYFDIVSVLNLTPTPSAHYTFQGWSPTCSGGNGINDCGFNLGVPVTKTATFLAVEQLRNNTSSTPYYYIQDAFNVAANNDEIWLQSFASVGILTASSPPLLFNRPNVTVKLRGGWNNTYNPAARTTNDFSVISAPLVIQNGTLRTEQIQIRQ